MKRNLKLFNLLCCGLVTSTMFMASCSDDDNNKTSGGGKPYDPSQPIKLETFYPDSGGIAQKVILKGSNFGTDPSQIKVYYNEKPAAIVSSNGDMIYAITPKQPGDTCDISVVIGNDSVVFDKNFFYRTMVTVTTIAGKPGTNNIKDGTLAEAEFNGAFFVCVDKEKNIFVSEREGHALRQVNEEANIVTTLIKNDFTYPNAPTTDPEGKTVFVPLDGGDVFYEFDPAIQWTPKRVKPRKKEGTPDFDIDYKHSLAPRISDGQLYTRSWKGQLIKFDPRTKAAELLESGLMPSSDSFLAFHPQDDNMLYICYPNKHIIFTYNLLTGEHKPFAGIQNQPGYMDGESGDAQFRDPKQICFDKDGNLYIADRGNHIIRKVDTNGMVSTVIGIPGVSGYVDGNPDFAMFNNPWGVAIDDDGIIYIGDANNDCLRKLSIE